MNNSLHNTNTVCRAIVYGKLALLCVLPIHCIPIMPVPIETPVIAIITALAAIIIASVMILRRYAHSMRA